MKIHFAYNFTGNDKLELKDMLIKLSGVLESLGHETSIFFRDRQNWGDVNITVDEIASVVFSDIMNSDLLLFL